MNALAALLLLSAASSPSQKEPGQQAVPRSAEVRGLWVVRTALVSPAEVDRVVEEAERAGFNTLFVQVRGRGDAFYSSRETPRSPLLREQPVDFDPLARLIQRARERGLDVHAWVNVLLVAGFGMPLPPGHAVERHPEWLMVPRSVARPALAVKPGSLASLIRNAAAGDPDVEGYYLSPSAPGVAETLEAAVREIVRGYPVRGLHLDFIRYPGPEYDWSRAALEGFARRQARAGDVMAGPAADPEGWERYRRETLTRLAERLASSARAERPGLVMSAAVVADQDTAIRSRFQDWPEWLSRGVLDAVCPMAYTADSRIFRQQVAEAGARIGPGQAVWAGVGAYRLAVDGILEKIALAREAGAAGVVLFSHESLQPRDLERLRGVFPRAAVSTAPAGYGSSGTHPR